VLLFCYLFVHHRVIIILFLLQIMIRYSSTVMIYQRQMHHHSWQRSYFLCCYQLYTFYASSAVSLQLFLSGLTSVVNFSAFLSVISYSAFDSKSRVGGLFVVCGFICYVIMNVTLLCFWKPYVTVCFEY